MPHSWEQAVKDKMPVLKCSNCSIVWLPDRNEPRSWCKSEEKLVAGWADTPGATDSEKEQARLAINLLRRFINDPDVSIQISSNRVQEQWIHAELNMFDIDADEFELLESLKDND